MFAVRGSGFGLYGYVPALVSCGQEVVLPERYRARFAERPELAPYADRVSWARDEAAALDRASGAVSAVRPADQVEWIDHCLARPGVVRLVLEKPLAPTPDGAARLLDGLLRAGKTFRIGYLFRDTAWGRRFLDLPKAHPLDLRWTFMAHHFRRDLQSWKRSHAAGGGAVRFYGIQLVALLAEAGYRDVHSSRTRGRVADEPHGWSATFTGPGLAEGRVEVDSRCETDALRVTAGDLVVADLREPFESDTTAGGPGEPDRRVPLLAGLCRSLWAEDGDVYERYTRAVDLWRLVEERTEVSLTA